MLTNSEKVSLEFHSKMKPTLTYLYQEISGGITTDVTTHNTHTHTHTNRPVCVFSVPHKLLYAAFRETSKR
jgi:hypothetical protein